VSERDRAETGLVKRAAAFVGSILLVASCSGAPDIGHSITQTSDSHCLSCHLEGVGEAPKTPHPLNTVCVDCHSTGATNDVGATAWPGP
jgi:hypothetical protein